MHSCQVDWRCQETDSRSHNRTILQHNPPARPRTPASASSSLQHDTSHPPSSRRPAPSVRERPNQGVAPSSGRERVGRRAGPSLCAQVWSQVQSQSRVALCTVVRTRVPAITLTSLTRWLLELTWAWMQRRRTTFLLDHLSANKLLSHTVPQDLVGSGCLQGIVLTFAWTRTSDFCGASGSFAL